MYFFFNFLGKYFPCIQIYKDLIWDLKGVHENIYNFSIHWPLQKYKIKILQIRYQFKLTFILFMKIFSTYILIENSAQMMLPYNNPLCHTPLLPLSLPKLPCQNKKQQKPNNQTKPNQKPTKTRNHSIPEDNFKL